MCVLRANAQCCLIPKWCKVNGTTLTGIAALLQLWTTLPSIFLTLKHVRMATPTQCQARGQHFVAIARCLKITEKVSFNIASEASYVYILSGQKFIKKAKNAPFWRVFENLKLAVKQCCQTGQF